MNAKALLAIAAVAATFSVGARANEAADSQFALKFEGQRTRAEVQAEAASINKGRSLEQQSARVMPVMKSGLTREQLRSQAAEAVRLGQIQQGEISRI